MKRIVDVEMTINCKKFETAMNRFFKKYPDLDYWKETFEYMHDHGENLFCDNLFNDGTENKDWSYALRLYEDCGYDFTVIERA